MPKQEVDSIPFSDVVLSNLNEDEKNACNLALKKINDKGEGKSLLTAMLEFG